MKCLENNLERKGRRVLMMNKENKEKKCMKKKKDINAFINNNLIYNMEV